MLDLNVKKSKNTQSLIYIVLIIISFSASCLFAKTHYETSKDNWITNSTDFRAFYCAGKALREQKDPYLVEPVRSCERKILQTSTLAFDEQHILIAPMPPSSLLPFVIISFLSPVDATIIWLNIIAVCVIGTSVLISKITNIRWPYCLLALLLSDGYTSIIIGQLVPVAVLGITTAAYAVKTKNRWLLITSLIVATIEPHLAIPAIIGCLVFIKAERVAILSSLIALSVINIVISLKDTKEYITRVIPAHARSEISNFGGQYGLPALLHAYEVPTQYALIIGSVEYIIMIVIGLFIAKKLIHTNTAFSITAPVAAALLGGPFLHIHQFAASVPFALSIASAVRECKGSKKVPVYMATLLSSLMLSIPWQTIEETGPIADSYPPIHSQIKPPPLPRINPTDSIEISYTAYIDKYANIKDNRTREEQLWWKLPTWLGLITLLMVGLTWSDKVTRNELEQRKTKINNSTMNTSKK